MRPQCLFSVAKQQRCRSSGWC